MLRVLTLVAVLFFVNVSAQAQPNFVPDEFQGAYLCMDPSKRTCLRGREYVFVSGLQVIFADRICWIGEFKRIAPDQHDYVVRVDCPNSRRYSREEWWNLSFDRVGLADGFIFWVNLKIDVYLGGETGKYTLRKISFFAPPPRS